MTTRHYPLKSKAMFGNTGQIAQLRGKNQEQLIDLLENHGKGIWPI